MDKFYNLIAAALHSALPGYTETEEGLLAYGQCNRDAHRIADALATSDPGFDPERFLKAFASGEPYALTPASTLPALYCTVCGEKFYTPELAAQCKHDSPYKFATATWEVGDITGVAPSLSEDEAFDWLSNNERNLRDLMIARGWDAIYNLLDMDGIATGDIPNYDDAEPEGN